MKASEVLIKAKAVIADPEHWTKGAYAKREDGTVIVPTAHSAHCFCALGAVRRVEKSRGVLYSEVGNYLNMAAAMPVDQFNDSEFTTHPMILGVFDDAIKMAQESEKR